MPIVRNLLLVAVAVMLIPAPPEDPSASAGSTLTTPGLIVAATQTVDDLGDFCVRQPGVCETAQYVAGKLELKAKYGVRVIYEWANEAGSDGVEPPGLDEADASDALVTGSLKLAEAQAAAPAATTLEILEDLIPQWREPAVSEES